MHWQWYRQRLRRKLLSRNGIMLWVGHPALFQLSPPFNVMHKVSQNFSISSGIRKYHPNVRVVISTMGIFTSKPMLDPENVGHILLGTSAFLSSCYVIIYRMFIFGEKIGWLSRFWLAYTMTQSIKCVMTVESNIQYGYVYGYTTWPDFIRFFNMILTSLVSFENLCLWTTLLFKSGFDYEDRKNITRYHLVLKLWLASFVVEVLATIIIYAVYGFAFSAEAYTLPISIFYVVAFWVPSWAAVGYTLHCAKKGRLMAINKDDDNDKVCSLIKTKANGLNHREQNRFGLNLPLIQCTFSNSHFVIYNDSNPFSPRYTCGF